MNTVQFDNIEYTKASDVARQFGYTADYIGQLCRARKVNARLIGRTWFVHVPSLEEHRQTKYSTIKNVATSSKEGKSKPETIETPDIPSKKYLRRVPAPEAKIKKIIQRTDEAGSLRHLTLSYEPDDNSLIPKVAQNPKVTLLKVAIADAERLPVSSVVNKSIGLAPTALPDVALSGVLTVKPIPDSDVQTNDEVVKEDLEKNISDIRDNEEKQAISEEESKAIHPVSIRISHAQKVDSQQTKLKMPEKTKSITRERSVPGNKTTVLPVTNASEGDFSNVHKEIQVTDANESPVPSPVNIVFLTASVLLAVIIGAAVLASEQVILTSTFGTESEIKFDLSNISNIASILFTVT